METQIPRLRRNAIITEKIDGTNAQILEGDELPKGAAQS